MKAFRLRALVVSLIIVACAPGFAHAESPVTLAPVGAWCWFGDPRAIEWDGRVVFGWVDGNGSIVVGGDRGERFVLHDRLQYDDHNNPSFYVRRDGRLMAFWSAHQGDALYYRTADAIDDWGPVRTVPPNASGDPRRYTYPNPVRVGETLYLFWSGGGDSATYATSTDDGDTWSPARDLFEVGNHVRYVKYVSDGHDIHMAWRISHPRFREDGIRHAVIREGRVYRQDGTEIGHLGTPLPPDAGDRIYEPALAGNAWIHDIEIGPEGPVIAYATFPALDAHTYRYARWDGSDWADEHLTDAGPSFNPGREDQYSGGIALDPIEPSVAYLSRAASGQFEIERWERAPGGGWTSEAITAGSSALNVRPYPVGGGVAWMRGEYPAYWAFETSLVWLPPRSDSPDPVDPVEPVQPVEPVEPVRQPATAGRQTPAAGGSLPSPSSERVRQGTERHARGDRCRRPLRRWRSSHRPMFLFRYWRCRARADGSCRVLRRRWRRTKSPAVRVVLRRHCRSGLVAVL